MKYDLMYLSEPQIEFGHRQYTEDCRDGLTLFGPYEKKSGDLRIGFVGSKINLELYRSFVESLNKPIYTKSAGRPFFPGFEAVFGVKWPSNPTATLLIDDSEIEELLRIGNLKERTYALVSKYLERVKKYADEEELVVELWYVVIPYEIWRDCRPKSHSVIGQISKKRMQVYQSGQTSLFDKEDRVEEFAEIYETDADFHDQFKARALQEKIQAPIQIVLDCTLQFKGKNEDEAFDSDMKAHIAWTHSSSVYYKLGYLPWKLASIRPGVCYIGLVFKKLEQLSKPRGFACCAAQMFLDSGDGTVFRGNNGPWMSMNEKTFHLNTEESEALIKQALDSYFGKHNQYPAELFIHGRTSFSNDEWEGFTRAVACAEKTKVVGVTINDGHPLRIYREPYNDQGQFGVLRGLACIIDEKSGYLWTKGYIPKTETANHMEVARPLKISITRGSADIEVVMRDILSLTKLNYNACIYGDGLPVTLKFSDRVGDILTALPKVDKAVKPFKYYI